MLKNHRPTRARHRSLEKKGLFPPINQEEDRSLGSRTAHMRSLDSNTQTSLWVRPTTLSKSTVRLSPKTMSTLPLTLSRASWCGAYEAPGH